MILNMISTGSMVKSGKVYQNLMVDLIPSNEKLRTWATNIVVQATGCSVRHAEQALAKADGRVKVAVVMLLLGQTCKQAAAALDTSSGDVRAAIKHVGKGETWTCKKWAVCCWKGLAAKTIYEPTMHA